MSKKKLDELFQDTFSGHNEVPDERVWDSIAASLDKKKKKRILPIWWSLSGIAAALVFGLLIFKPFTSENTTEQIITNVDKKNSNAEENDTISKKDLKLNKTDENSIKIAAKEKAPAILDSNSTQVVDTENNENPSFENPVKKKTNQETKNGENWIQKNNAIVQSQNKQPENSNKRTEEINGNKKNNLMPSNTKIAQGETSVEQKDKEKNLLNKSNILRKIVGETKEVDGVATNENTPQKESNGTILQNSNSTKETSVKGASVEVADNQSKPEQITPAIDTKKSIFDEINSEEEEAVANTNSKKWSAGPSVAPVYFNAIGEGSSVHSIFVPNSKSGNINMSYGLSVGYEINSKFKIRTGIHSVNLGYDTNDVSFSSSPTASTNGQIDNIDYTLTARNLVVSSQPGGSALSEAPVNSLDVSAQNPEREGFMTQQLGYLEIPVELNYTLINRKFGLNLIGGVSSLFLMDNSVALTSGNLTTEMGEANNINDLNFSANFGLGVNYNFSQNIQLNIEPVFKYQLNTFSETDGTFNPYALGIYSGLSFKF
jgi:hypothetical protein